MALPCENPEGNHVKHIRMMTLYSHERYSHEEVEEVIEEIKPSLFRQMPQVASTACFHVRTILARTTRSNLSLFR
jgi:hypothetical protein